MPETDVNALQAKIDSLEAAIVPVLEALDKAFYGGQATRNDARPFLSAEDINDVGGPVHAALELLRGVEKKPAKKTKKTGGGEE